MSFAVRVCAWRRVGRCCRLDSVTVFRVGLCGIAGLLGQSVVHGFGESLGTVTRARRSFLRRLDGILRRFLLGVECGGGCEDRSIVGERLRVHRVYRLVCRLFHGHGLRLGNRSGSDRCIRERAVGTSVAEGQWIGSGLVPVHRRLAGIAFNRIDAGRPVGGLVGRFGGGHRLLALGGHFARGGFGFQLRERLAIVATSNVGVFR